MIGAGPGIGLSVARRFARAGLSVGVVARSAESIEKASAALAGTSHAGVTADAADEPRLRAALDELVDRFGVPEIVVYNAAIIQADAIGELTAAEHLDALAVNLVGAITTADHLLPRMAATGAGTYLMTGGMPAPVEGMTTLSIAKPGLRALAGLLDQQYRSAGLRVATVTVTGTVAPGTAFDPDLIAERYWQLHAEHGGRWAPLVAFEGLG